MKFTFIGHSHIICMEGGRQRLGQDFNISAEFVQLHNPALLKDKSPETRHWCFSNYDEKILEQIVWNATKNASLTTLCPDGNAHNIAALVNSHHSEASLFNIIEKGLLNNYRHMLSALSRYTGSPALVLPAPPPISSEIISKNPGLFAEKIGIHGIAPDELRIRAWLHQTRLTRRMASECGLFFLELPQEVFSDNGLLHAQFEGKDPTHANDAYGESIIRHLVNLMETPSWISTISLSKGRDIGNAAVGKGPASKQDKLQHPYLQLSDHAFWKQAVAGVSSRQLDPVGEVPFRIRRSDKVASAGSCFAQHISKRIRSHGFQFLITENPVDSAAPDGQCHDLYDFSARYGNIYTARQLVQLFDRAFGYFCPLDDYWERPDMRFCDPFRPRIKPRGFESVEALVADRQRHLAAVRQMFSELDIFIFTLGLTECWISRLDGAAYPLAPGVAGGEFNSARHEFINLGVNETLSDLESFIRKLRLLNSRAKLILTVSPVPLAATYGLNHVLVATTYSKSVLRVAADMASRSCKDVYYFPSFEIITGNFNSGRYFGPDLRSVTEEGIDHVMAVFMRNLTEDCGIQSLPLEGVKDIESRLDKHLQEMAVLAEAACDEESLQR